MPTSKKAPPFAIKGEARSLADTTPSRNLMPEAFAGAKDFGKNARNVICCRGKDGDAWLKVSRQAAGFLSLFCSIKCEMCVCVCDCMFHYPLNTHQLECFL